MVVEPGARREAVLHELGHQRLGIGEGGNAVSNVAGRDDPELLAQPPAAPTVVGDGHDGRDIGAVALQAAQQRREPGPAADGHDPRAARQVPLRVQHLEDALVAADEGRHDRAHEAPHADSGQRKPEHCHQAGPDLRLEPRAGEPVDDRDLVRRVCPVQVADEDRRSQPEDDDADQQQKQPALDVHSRVEPARQPSTVHRSSSRWKTVTATSGSSARRSASSSARAIERWKPPVHPSAIRS